MVPKRQIAYKASVKEILQGRYVVEEGLPNYLETPDGRNLSRVNIIGTVVSKEKEPGYEAFLFDDGSGTLSIRMFEENQFPNFEVGDVVLVIGRPRAYGSDKYLSLEIIKKVNKKWISVRNLEGNSFVPAKKKSKVVEEPIENGYVSEKILDYIRKADNGEGVDFDNVLGKFPDESVIQRLLSEGELFEIKPGKLKVLE